MKLPHYAETANSKGRMKVPEDVKDVNKLTLSKLIRSYLCEGSRSPCVQNRECDCLGTCVYGKRYIALTKEKTDE